MLTKLRIENFQSHEKRTIRISPHLTVITGPSDIGKSAIIRAIKWVALNRPAGTEFIRTGSDTAKVTVYVDGSRVKRTRSKTLNAYTINGKRLVSFKSDVPSEVARTLNLSELNFQSQIDPPFWLSLSAGDVSKRLNEIINLSSIDTTLTNLGKESRQNNAALLLTRSRLKEAKSDRAKLSHVEDMKRDFDRLSETNAAALELREQQERLTALLADMRERRDRLSVVFKKKQELGKIWELAGEVSENAEQCNALSLLISRISRAKSNAKRRYVEIDTVTPINALRRLDSLSELLNKIRTTGKNVTKSQSKLSRPQRKYDELLGNRCPLCLSKIEP